jgi:hypothetical protein
MYEKSNAGARLRKYTFCSLAWWHSYKWATKEVVKVFSSDFLGQWFHSLWPDRDWDAAKISHPARTTYLSYIRLAYPQFKSLLDRAMAMQGLNQRQITLFTNLKDMCEFFIPAVSFYRVDELMCG